MQTANPNMAVPAKCSYCGVDLRYPMVCTRCERLNAAADPADFFRLVGFPRTFQINPAELNSRFLEITRLIHPDRFSAAEPETQQLATRLSAVLNEATATLSDPVARAEYLLELSGGLSAIEDRTVPQEVLGAVLMIREEMEEAAASGDTVSRLNIANQISTLESATLRKLTELAERLPEATDEEKKQLRCEINSVKYFQKLREEMEGMEP